MTVRRHDRQMDDLGHCRRELAHDLETLLVPGRIDDEVDGDIDAQAAGVAVESKGLRGTTIRRELVFVTLRAAAAAVRSPGARPGTPLVAERGRDSGARDLAVGSQALQIWADRVE